MAKKLEQESQQLEDNNNKEPSVDFLKMISVDLAELTDLVEVDLFANPQESLQRINEIDQIFAKTQDQITNTLTGFKDRNSLSNFFPPNANVSL